MWGRRMEAVQRREAAADELSAAQERGADPEEIQRLEDRHAMLAREACERDQAMQTHATEMAALHAPKRQRDQLSASVTTAGKDTKGSEPDARDGVGAGFGGGGGGVDVAAGPAAAQPHCAQAAEAAADDATAPASDAAWCSDNALPFNTGHRRARVNSPTLLDPSTLPEGSALREIIEKTKARGEPSQNDADDVDDDEDDEDDEDGDSWKVLPPATDYSAFVDRLPCPLEELYARAMAGRNVNKADRLVVKLGRELSKLSFDQALEGRAQGAYAPSEVLSCRVCFALLTKPWTLSCGHTLCQACCDKIRKCPLPGR